MRVIFWVNRAKVPVSQAVFISSSGVPHTTQVVKASKGNVVVFDEVQFIMFYLRLLSTPGSFHFLTVLFVCQ